MAALPASENYIKWITPLIPVLSPDVFKDFAEKDLTDLLFQVLGQGPVIFLWFKAGIELKHSEVNMQSTRLKHLKIGLKRHKIKTNYVSFWSLIWGAW